MMELNTRRKRRIMRALRLEEISSVDTPAQLGARMTILKRNELNSEGAQTMARPESFEKAVERIRHHDPSLTATRAWSRAARLWPDLVKAYQTDGIAIQAMHEEIARADLEKRNAPEVQQFDLLCDDIQARDHCFRLDALRKAPRSMDGESFDKYRAALD